MSTIFVDNEKSTIFISEENFTPFVSEEKSTGMHFYLIKHITFFYIF